VVPLALGAAVNTRVLATEAALLTSSARPLSAAAVFGAGVAAPLLLIGVIDVISVHITVSAVSDERALFASSVADVVVGFLLLAAAAWLVVAGRRSGPREAAPRFPAAPSDRTRTFLRGAVVTATDLSTMAMFVTASKDIAVGRLGVPLEAGVFLLALGIALTAAWLPPAVFAGNPALARRLLDPVGLGVRHHGRTIAEVLLAAAGLYLVARGLVGIS